MLFPVRKRRAAATLAALLMIVPPTFSQDASGDIAQALSGATIPLTLKLGDLTEDWRRMSIGRTADAGGGMGAYLQAMSAMFGGGDSVYYTKGQTVTIDGQKYLVAYRRRGTPLDFTAIMRPGAQPPQPQKLTADAPLSLSLLNLRTTTSFDDIRPFRLQEELAAAEAAAKAMTQAQEEMLEVENEGRTEDASLSNLKRVGRALLMYIQDHDEVLPPMQDADTAKKALLPYASNDTIFQNPQSKRPYQPNPILSKKKLAHIADPASFVAFYEPGPVTDNTRDVLFLDGRVKTIGEAEWPRLRRASKINDSR